MPKIRFAKTISEIEVVHGANLMQSLLSAGLPVASSCHGDGVCAKCRIQIVEGAENLSQLGSAEVILRERLRLPKDVRISCQTKVLGDVKVDASYW